MRILVDADACPVKDIIEKLARKHGLPVLMISNVNHLIKSDYSQVIVVDGAAEAADIAIVNLSQPGDIIVTQDYGLASMLLAKRARVIHPLGKIYNDENIDGLLMQRFIGQKARKAGLRTTGPKKRNPLDDKLFEVNLDKMIEELTKP